MRECKLCGNTYEGSVGSEWCTLCHSLAFCGLPERYLKACRSDMEDKYKQLVDGHESLFIHGEAGVGKTWLAAAIMREQMSRTAKTMGQATMYTDDSLFVSFPELALMVRDSMNRNSDETERRIINRYGNVRTLILDDIGAENVTGFMKSTMHILIERRNTKLNSRTIITSNWTLRELDKEYGPRVPSRISEMCRIIKMTGKDMRSHAVDS